MTSDPEGFLSRWSRRKRGGALPAEDVAPVEVPPVEEETLPFPATVTPIAAEVASPEPEPAPSPALPPPELPSIDSLVAESDISAFLRPGVPSGLRHAAMRRMWSLDTAIRDFIGPADYAWDYNAVDGVPGGTTSLVTNDLRSMLAQAIGRTEVQLDAEDAAAQGDDSPLAEPSLLPQAPVEYLAGAVQPEQEADIPAFIPPEIIAEARPQLALFSPAAPVPETPNPRRRHGGALPV
ncbi:uncharacterized protein DUF3306 [Humitalea rosea]|uniref:Uncharacterized protein DUF3306 n=1 Tax=Humitalea rosea TaxID=990373 RepID=A0A2W7I7L3_9PROT|nr:DUF3306 domain-containing protein [Humitalea rosea]PZW42249.1 uncharacterized protein DUF3306 [Humitalea rosea]